LDVVGIDIVSPDISIPLNENGGTVIDVNAAPDFKVHICPNAGLPRLVQKQFLDMLFPAGSHHRVPLISVTGSHGKSLYTTIIEKYFIQKGIYCGSLRTDGLFINGKLIKSIDLNHADSTSLLLKDPTIGAAVVETPVETILNSGLGYRMADIGVVLNLTEREEYYTYDHIRDVEDVAYAKSVVAEQVYNEGYTILNAAVPLILEMTERLYSKVAYFSRTRPTGLLYKLMQEGHPIAYSDGTSLMLSRSGDEIVVCKWDEVTAAIQDNEYIMDVILAAAMTFFLLGENQQKIKEILCGI
jgi:cyanophycin synthetase